MKAFLSGFLVIIVIFFINDSYAITEKEFYKLPEEKRKEVLVEEFESNQGKGLMKKYLKLITLMHMHNFGYFIRKPSDDQVIQYYKHFQKQLGVPETGKLTMGQFERFLEQPSIRHEPQTYIGLFLQIKVGEQFAFAKGAWEIVGDKIADPINFSTIECFKRRGVCTEAYVALTVPKINKTDSQRDISLDTTTFEIISWKDGEIVAKPVSDKGCKTRKLIINGNSQEVTEIVTNNKEEQCAVGDLIPADVFKLDKPRISRMVKPFDTQFAYWENRKKEKEEIYNKFFSKNAMEIFKKFGGQIKAPEQALKAEEQHELAEFPDALPRERAAKGFEFIPRHSRERK